MTTTMTTTLPELIYALVWQSDWAGDAPGDQIVAASLDPIDPKLTERVGQRTYDGTSARSQGRFRVVENHKPSSIATLETKFAGRVEFGLSGADLPGCWIDSKPYRMIDGRWTWNRAERQYLEALAVLRGEYTA